MTMWIMLFRYSVNDAEVTLYKRTPTYSNFCSIHFILGLTLTVNNHHFTV